MGVYRCQFCSNFNIVGHTTRGVTGSVRDLRGGGDEQKNLRYGCSGGMGTAEPDIDDYGFYCREVVKRMFEVWCHCRGLNVV